MEARMNCSNCEKLQSELLQAQASISEMRSLCCDMKQSSWESKFDKIFKQTVNLSALEKHDADLKAQWEKDHGTTK
jgi:hypothetical protein